MKKIAEIVNILEKALFLLKLTMVLKWIMMGFALTL